MLVVYFCRSFTGLFCIFFQSVTPLHPIRASSLISSMFSYSSIIASSFSLKCLTLAVGQISLTGAKASRPKAKVYGVCPVAVLYVVL